jgi:RHS repeat-associated protein
VGSGVLGGAITQAINYVPNIKGGSNTVTVTFNQSASYPDVRVLEYSGLLTTSPLDVVATGTGNSTSSSSGSATTSSATELIFGANTVYTGTNAAGSGFTSRIITHDGDIAEDKNVSSTGSYSASATLSSAGNWVMQMATFKAATTSGTSVYADMFREQNYVQGRWISPDPAGFAAVDPMNPQTWNRYAYVGGNPLNAVDPAGLACYALERKLFGSCAGLMDNGVNFGVSWNEFTILTEFILQIDLATEVTHTISYGDLSPTVAEGGTFYPASLSIGTGWFVLGPSTQSVGYLNDLPYWVVPNPNGKPTQPSVPRPPDPVKRYADCSKQVHDQAAKNRMTETLIQQTSFSLIEAGCVFTGPGAPECLGIVGGVNLLNTAIIWGSYYQSIWNGETQCMQQP